MKPTEKSQIVLLTLKRNRPKPPHPLAIRLILLAKISAEAFLLAAHLQKHDDDERDKHQHSLPSPKPDANAGVVDETPCQHGVAAQAVRAFRHQVLRAGRHLVPEGIHGVAVAFAPHVDDGPHAERQSQHRQHEGNHLPQRRGSREVGHPRNPPHQGRDEQHEHRAAEGVTRYFSEFSHTASFNR